MVSLNIICLNYTLSCKYINFNVEFIISVCTTKLTIMNKKSIPGSKGDPSQNILRPDFHTYSLKHFA